LFPAGGTKGATPDAGATLDQQEWAVMELVSGYDLVLAIWNLEFRSLFQGSVWVGIMRVFLETVGSSEIPT
jgi:hypothetical protein